MLPPALETGLDNGNLQADHCASARAALNIELPALSITYTFYVVQPEPKAFYLMDVASGYAVEFTKNPVKVLL